MEPPKKCPCAVGDVFFIVVFVFGLNKSINLIYFKFSLSLSNLIL